MNIGAQASLSHAPVRVCPNYLEGLHHVIASRVHSASTVGSVGLAHEATAAAIAGPTAEKGSPPHAKRTALSCHGAGHTTHQRLHAPVHKRHQPTDGNARNLSRNEEGGRPSPQGGTPALCRQARHNTPNSAVTHARQIINCTHDTHTHDTVSGGRCAHVLRLLLAVSRGSQPATKSAAAAPLAASQPAAAATQQSRSRLQLITARAGLLRRLRGAAGRWPRRSGQSSWWRPWGRRQQRGQHPPPWLRWWLCRWPSSGVHQPGRTRRFPRSQRSGCRRWSCRAQQHTGAQQQGQPDSTLRSGAVPSRAAPAPNVAEHGPMTPQNSQADVELLLRVLVAAHSLGVLDKAARRDGLFVCGLGRGASGGAAGGRQCQLVQDAEAATFRDAPVCEHTRRQA